MLVLGPPNKGFWNRRWTDSTGSSVRVGSMDEQFIRNTLHWLRRKNRPIITADRIGVHSEWPIKDDLEYSDWIRIFEAELGRRVKRFRKALQINREWPER